MMFRNTFIAIFSICIMLLMQSCGSLYPSVMFKTKESEVTNDSTAFKDDNSAYVLRAGDEFTFTIYSNDGYKMIDQGLAEVGIDQGQSISGVQFLLNNQGDVRLPTIGVRNLAGKSLEEAESYLEAEYSALIKNPYIRIKVTNWRVYVFKGMGEAQVIQINNQNTSLVELIAESGGLPENTKANRIKVIRGDLQENTKVFVVDYSSLSSAKVSNFQLQSGDIVIVEPITRLSSGVLKELTPYFGLITTFLLLFNLIQGNG